MCATCLRRRCLETLEWSNCAWDRVAGGSTRVAFEPPGTSLAALSALGSRGGAGSVDTPKWTPGTEGERGRRKGDPDGANLLPMSLLTLLRSSRGCVVAPAKTRPPGLTQFHGVGPPKSRHECPPTVSDAYFKRDCHISRRISASKHALLC